MRKNQIEVGGRYTAKIAGNLTVVRITGESQYGGWQAINERTGRAVRIKSAAKLRSAVGSEERRSIAVQRERAESVEHTQGYRNLRASNVPHDTAVAVARRPPFAPADITDEGVVRICPVCGERCVDPRFAYDEHGEQTAPSAYQNHYAEKHADEEQ